MTHWIKGKDELYTTRDDYDESKTLTLPSEVIQKQKRAVLAKEKSIDTNKKYRIETNLHTETLVPLVNILQFIYFKDRIS